MGQLHEVLAILPSTKGTAQKIAGETLKTFKDKSEHFHGALRKYDPLQEGDPGLPPESNPLVTTAGEKLGHFAECFGPWLDAEYQVAVTNMKASATVEVDGLKLEGVPATFLMQLDKRLSDVRNVYDAAPTLDPKQEWSGSDKGKGVFQSEDEIRNRTEKKPMHKVIVPATPEHPAQVAGWNEDIVIGKYTTKRWSGALSVEQKYEVLKRIDVLQKAVKRALSAANRVDHVGTKVARQVFGFINGALPLKR